MDDQIKENIKNGSIWVRGLFMALFAVIYGIAEIVFTAVAVFQFLFVLISGKRNGQLLSFGSQMATFIYQIVNFQTFNSEEKPFPFSDWPSSTETATPAAGDEPPLKEAAPPARGRKKTAKKAETEKKA